MICIICGNTIEQFSNEHIIPKAIGGKKKLKMCVRNAMKNCSCVGIRQKEKSLISQGFSLVAPNGFEPLTIRV